MHLKEKIRKEYQTIIFRPLAIMLIIIVIVINIILYFMNSTYILSSNRKTLERIAYAVAQQVPVVTHETLREPSQQNTDDYKYIEKFFQTVLIANPQLDDIYTLRPSETAHKYTFVVSGEITRDRNNNGQIEVDEYKANLGEDYDASEAPQLEKGLEEISSDENITYDKWGAWLSGYAPLIDASGKHVGILGVDMAADQINTEKWRLLKKLLISDAIILSVSLVVFFLLSRRLANSFSLVAEAMSRASQGDLTYRIPLHKHDTSGHMSELYNAMMTHFADQLEHAQKKHSIDNEVKS